MDRKAFLRVLPGLFLTKQIIAEFAKAPVNQGSKGIYWQMMNMTKNATVVDYRPQDFNIEMLYEIIQKEYAKPRVSIDYRSRIGWNIWQ